MYISDFNLFYMDVKSHWASIVKEDLGNQGKNAKDGAQRAYAVYKNTYQASLPFIVLGTDRIRSDEKLVGNFGLITADLSKKKTPYRQTTQRFDIRRTAMVLSNQ